MQTLLFVFFFLLMLVSLGVVLFFGFRTMRAQDQLIRFEVEHLPEQWEKDGQPRGMFWKPEGKKVRLVNRLLMGNPIFPMFRFLLTTPNWVKENPETATCHREFRKFALLWNICLPAWFLVWFCVILPLLGKASILN